jgi:hypothetical protein
MNKTKLIALTLLTLLSMALTNCQCSREIKCGQLSGQREACDRDDDCRSMTHPYCAGAAAKHLSCRVDVSQNKCVPDTERPNCPRDLRLFTPFSGSIPSDLQTYKWAYDKLSDRAKTMVGKKLTKTDVEALTATDSDILCSVISGQTCKMAWDEKAGKAVCFSGAEECGSAKVVSPPNKCQAKNKCGGVICF